MRRAGSSFRARYDAAQTSGENRKHWGQVDHLSARSANNTGVRQILRDRSRYEYANNGYAAGIVTTLANDLIGDGPKLQLTSGDPDENREVEAAYYDWCQAINLPEKLRTMRQARAVDGEAFAVMETNPMLDGPVQLDVRLYEAEQFHSPFPYPISPYLTDGITFDSHMNPVSYDLLWEHPGDETRFSFGFKYDTIPARFVLHWFRPRRPQEFRGVPELTPALPLFAQLRRYTLAVLAAAETAADFAAVLYSELPPDATDPQSQSDEFEPFDSFDIDKRLMTTLPAGWKLDQFKAEQPVNTYSMFKAEVLNEIARALGVPYNIAAGNSSTYNYASGRLDHQTYYRDVQVEQCQLGSVYLCRIFKAWLAEYALATRAVRLDRPDGWAHRWLWPGQEHVDPLKEAHATDIQLKNYSSTFVEECYKDGVDPETRVREIALGRDLFKKYGLPDPYAPVPASPGQSPPPIDPNADDGEDPNAQDQGSAGYGGRNGHALNGFVHRNGHARS